MTAQVLGWCGTHRLSGPLAVAVRGRRINSSPDSSACRSFFHLQEKPMSISVANIQPIVALIAGVLILVMPRLLNFIVAIYLILVGIIGLGIIK
jgi:hypothetical protein